MSSQFLMMPCSSGCVIWSRLRYCEAKSPTTMSPRSVGKAEAEAPEEAAERSSARRMGRPTIEGKVCAGKSVGGRTMNKVSQGAAQ